MSVCKGGHKKLVQIVTNSVYIDPFAVLYLPVLQMNYLTSSLLGCLGAHHNASAQGPSVLYISYATENDLVLDSLNDLEWPVCVKFCFMFGAVKHGFRSFATLKLVGHSECLLYYNYCRQG